MKTANSKLFRKLSLNRRSNRVSAVARAHIPNPTPIQDWWKARNVKDTQ